MDLEECARSISSGTTDTELAFLEDQVATAAAQVQQSELQVLEAPESHISLPLKSHPLGLFLKVCFSFSGVEHRVPDICSENSRAECGFLQPLLQVQAKGSGSSLSAVSHGSHFVPMSGSGWDTQTLG